PLSLWSCTPSTRVCVMIKLTPSQVEILKIWAKDLLRIYQTEYFTKEELEFIEEILSDEPK
ncbi:hypothetical protein, partial [Staphylococcus saprophyticus]|uniref:hypothetical protein n=1 Tax=Staphylococcus saprophyticus TaxID=29385 RepID=UPI001C93061E